MRKSVYGSIAGGAVNRRATSVWSRPAIARYDWILDVLLAAPDRVRLVVEALAEAFRPYRVDAFCGRLLGGTLLAQRVSEALGARVLVLRAGGAQRGDWPAPGALPAPGVFLRPT